VWAIRGRALAPARPDWYPAGMERDFPDPDLRHAAVVALMAQLEQAVHANAASLPPAAIEDLARRLDELSIELQRIAARL
jgi:hypothetical protein